MLGDQLQVVKQKNDLTDRRGTINREMISFHNWLVLTSQTSYKMNYHSWTYQEVPKGREVIGIYGKLGTDTIENLGFILWKPSYEDEHDMKKRKSQMH